MHDIFYFTDIHGMGDLYNAIMQYCKEQDEEAMIIFGGDAIDRGKDGYRIMKELLNNPKVVYLKGNHEDMFVKSARLLKKELSFDGMDRVAIESELEHCVYYGDYFDSVINSIYNGGLNTLTDWILDGMPMDIVEKVEKLPLTFTYNDMDFCHAGGFYDTFKKVYEKEYNDEKLEDWDADFLLWSRTNLDIGWTPNRTCIFGHTPTPYLPDYIEGFKWPEDCEITPVLYKRENTDLYKNMTGWKLDMDTGAAFTGLAYVLNILTMQAQGFRDNDIKNEEIRKHDIEKIEVIHF